MRRYLTVLVPVLLLGLGTQAAGQQDSADSAWQAWRESRIVEAAESAKRVLALEPENDRARHLVILTAFLLGDFETCIREYRVLSTQYEAYFELESAIVDAYLHLDRFEEAAEFARLAGHPEREVSWLQERAAKPLRAELASTGVIPFAEDNWLGELMPAIPIELNDREFLGHLDTGGTFIVTSPKMAAELGVDLQLSRKSIANNQETRISVGIADSLVMGDARLTNVPLSSVDSLSGPQLENLVIIGTNVLSRFLTTWDNESGRLVLSPRTDAEERARHLAEFASGVTAPFYLAGNHFMWAHGSVGDHDVLFFVDTGLVTLDEKGRQPSVSVPARTLESWGMSPNGAFLDSPGAIALGEARREGGSVHVAQDDRNLVVFHGLRPEVLLSHGFLKNFVWTIDFDERRYYLREVEVGPAATSGPPSEQGPMDEFVGTYEVAPGVALEVSSADGRLLLQAPGQQKIPMTAGAEADTFEIKLAGAVIRFERDESGGVGALVLLQAGVEQRAVRVPSE